MSFEKYTRFFDGEPNGITVRPQNSASFNFSAKKKQDTVYRLFTVGETEQFYMWKDEPDGPLHYRSIADSLNSVNAVRDRFCLDFSSNKKESYVKRAYKKLLWPPVLSYLSMNPIAENWLLGISVTGENVEIAEDGFLRMRLDIRLSKDGVSRHSVSEKPDKTVILPFPCGTYAQTDLFENIVIPKNTANVCVFVEGKNYSGKIYVEKPTLSADGQNLLPTFDLPVPNGEKFQWTGQYLSKKELPEFSVKLNGETVFEGEIFERSHRHSEWEITLPSHLLKEENTIEYKLISSYLNPLPYTFYEVGIIEQPDSEISVISVSECAPSKGKARVLVRTNKDNLYVRFESLSPAICGENEYFFKEKGLHGLLLDCLEPAVNQKFRLTSENCTAEGTVKRIAVKQEDGVITGSGDAVYIPQTFEAMEEYVSWYVSSNVGDLLTVRPTYRWSGTKTLNKPLWRWFARLMDELDIKYVLMADGREVPGISSQPTNKEMAGKRYLGRQDHEHDGSQFYWGQHKISDITQEQTEDLCHFAWQEDPEHTRGAFSDSAYICKGETLYLSADYDRPLDNKLCRPLITKQLNATRTLGATRHTGPASVFKYLYEGGYTWLGAETMYSAMEPLLGFLRGFAKDKEIPTFGVHHAVQWSSTPLGAPEHIRRFRLALYVSYMLGTTDINTEEGFWHMEEYYEHHHRFGSTCNGHLAQQQDFFRYVSSHTRSGSFRTPYALLSGRDDGITFFVLGRSWGIADNYTVAERSWELIKSLYPQSDPCTNVYKHNCPTDKPVGYHSSTPYGNPDIIPVEGRQETLNGYNTLIFMGYNRMTPEDAEKICSSVKNGATLLCTRAHLTKTSDIKNIENGNLEFDMHALALSDGAPEFKNDTFNGKKVSVCANPVKCDEVLLYTDSGLPLLCRYRIGKGEVLLFSVKDYPYADAIREVYAKAVTDCARSACDGEYVWAETDDDTEFAVYSQKDGSSHVYFIAVDWYRAPKKIRRARLRIGKEIYPVEMNFGTLIKCVCNCDCAIWATSEDGEVLSVSSDKATVQGNGNVTFAVAKQGKISHIDIDFKSAPIQELKF